MPGGSVVSVGVRFSRPWLRRGEARLEEIEASASCLEGAVCNSEGSLLTAIFKTCFFARKYDCSTFSVLGRPINSAEFYIAWFDPTCFQQLYIMSKLKNLA